jgi:hypothetical protein
MVGLVFRRFEPVYLWRTRICRHFYAPLEYGLRTTTKKKPEKLRRCGIGEETMACLFGKSTEPESDFEKGGGV